MKIVQIAPFEEPVPPEKYGGTELVVSNVSDGMAEAGHEVYLLASGDSTTKANLIPILPKSLRKMYDPSEIDIWRNYWKFAKIPFILKKIRELKPDIVHNHLNWRMVLFSDFIECPLMSTLHGPITSLTERETYRQYKNSNYVSISDNQRKAMPELNWVKTVYNGIQTEKFTFNENKGDYFAFLGRTSPEKGLAEICRMIKGTTHKLKIAAKVDSVDVPYFDREIKPFIDGRQIEFLGEVGHDGKNNLLKDAKALLLWLNWEEPFGLVVTEAMACGTPVIVNPRGSMGELIVDGKTGFLIDGMEGMKLALDKIGELSPRACRDHVEKNFSKQKMVMDYVSLAHELIDRQKK